MQQTRRSFSEVMIHVLGGLIGATLAGLGGVYLMTPARKQKTGGWVEAADVAKLATGAAEEVVFERRRADGWRLIREKTSAWIVKKSEQEIIAFAPGCTHLGCAFRYEAEKKNFLCPCHVSEFSLDGKVLSGPAPRPLDRYEVKLDNGRVLLGEIKKA
jgi:menaquinol-cytochrome c reductase iron-sulfur subunit